MQNQLTFLKPLVADVLRDEARAWTVQGFGFLRTYFGPPSAPKRFRLNLWHSRFTVPNVSTIHNHPWNFKSVIVAGNFTNRRYLVRTFTTDVTHECATIRTGEGGGLLRDTVSKCCLAPMQDEIYSPGCTYGQHAGEIHETLFSDGAVTLNERIGDTEHAQVFWPAGEEWVDAVPRRADREEIDPVIAETLEKHFY